jgi:spore maturation protein CgeB
MKIVIFGLSISSSWGNGHATLWRGLVKALRRRGHDVVFYERDTDYYRNNRDLEHPDGWRLEIYPSWEDIRAKARQDLQSADVGVVTSYCVDGIAASQEVCDAPCVHAFYDLDTPVTLLTWEREGSVPYIGPRGLRDFDVVFSYTGGEALARLQRDLGARHVVPLYGSADPESHAPVQVDKVAGLSYLGTYAADRQDKVERLFIEAARRRPDASFLLGGAQYPNDFPWTSNILFWRHVAPDYHSSFYAASRVTLNVTRASMASFGYCPSGRLFEAAACGIPVISDTWEGLEKFFTPGTEILPAATTEDVLAAIDLSPGELKAIGRNARERTLGEHTADHRAIEMEEALSNSMQRAN